MNLFIYSFYWCVFRGLNKILICIKQTCIKRMIIYVCEDFDYIKTSNLLLFVLLKDNDLFYFTESAGE